MGRRRRPALFPLLVEEAGVDDFAGPTRAGRGAEIDDGPVGELGGLEGVVGVAVGAEIEAAVEDDVARRIEWIREDQNGGVARGVVSFAAEREGFCVPRERELSGGEELCEDAVGGGVAPEYQVFGGEVGVGERGVGDDGGVAAEDVAPEVAGGGEFALDPGAELGVERFAGRADEDERFEEGVVHGTGEAGGFAEAASAAGAPRVAGAMKVERGIGGGDGLAVEHDGGGVDAGEGNGGDVFRVRFEAEAAVLRGADLRELPMLSHALDADPRGFGVAKGVGLQPNFAGAGVAALGDEGFETLRELGLGGVVVFVGGVGADETFQFQALFGEGGGAETAKRLSLLVGKDVPILGQVPFSPALREGGDTGMPVVVSNPESSAAKVFDEIVARIIVRPKSLVGVRLGLST